MGVQALGYSLTRRDGRADECEALEMLWAKSLVGSNPTPSATSLPRSQWARLQATLLAQLAQQPHISPGR
jgi:hypothetical protein